jgi:glyoxylase-like metal-dependent hydrolase (beta-lactamase superfamily II)
MAEAGYAPEDVDVVVFTHVHPDHILGVAVDGYAAFPNARYAISQVEDDEWKSGDCLPECRAANREMFLELFVPLADQMTILSPGDAVVLAITSMEAYGRSLGQRAIPVSGR